MPIITTNSKFQKNIGQFAKSVQKKPCIITTHGEPKMVVLPYFENNEDLIDDYFENFEMWQNQEKLQKKYGEALKSGKSKRVI
ncbi:hypothetical protein HN954_03190 [bacterium]|jgi:hypothetical protein|nr:hypothetical protein [bacterium]MBT6832144.1 hypothetical protein [bacterium]MBT6996410.1 hypothetical protein [bacterium]MBT7772145.1 hypothetical protein [bacterium]